MDAEVEMIMEGFSPEKLAIILMSVGHAVQDLTERELFQKVAELEVVVA
jgi:hypothetical protein